MCDEVPDIDNDIKKNTILISLLNDDYKNSIISNNDFFLLLLEYLEKINQGEEMLNTNGLEKISMSEHEKICYEFMNDCIEINNGRETCNDVYDRYIE